MNTTNLLRIHFINYFIPVRTARKKIIQRNIVDIFTKEEYEKQLETKNKPKKNTTATASKKSSIIIPTPIPLNSNVQLIPRSTLKLKYKKLRNLPGNILNSFLVKMKSSTFRQHHSLCLIPSTTVLKEAFECGYSIQNIYFNRLKKLQDFPADILRNVHLTHIPDRVLKSFPIGISDGVFAVAAVQDAKSRNTILKRRRNEENRGFTKLLPHIVIYEGIKSARLLGEMLKTAEENGCQQVYVMDDCADVWDMRSISAGQGAHFKIPIIHDMTWEKLEKLQIKQNILVSRHNADNVGLKDIASDDEVKKYDEVASVFNVLKSECSEGSQLEGVYSDVIIPCVRYDQVNLCQPSLILFGNISVEGFLHLCKVHHHEQLRCSFINTECDEAGLLEQLNTVLQECKRQKEKRKLSKEALKAV